MTRGDLQMAIILGSLLLILLIRACGTPAQRSAWRFDYLVRDAEARSMTQPCLRTTGPPCPRPQPLTPNYCPFPN